MCSVIAWNSRLQTCYLSQILHLVFGSRFFCSAEVYQQVIRLSFTLYVLTEHGRHPWYSRPNDFLHLHIWQKSVRLESDTKACRPVGSTYRESTTELAYKRNDNYYTTLRFLCFIRSLEWVNKCYRITSLPGSELCFWSHAIRVSQWAIVFWGRGVVSESVCGELYWN